MSTATGTDKAGNKAAAAPKKERKPSDPAKKPYSVRLNDPAGNTLRFEAKPLKAGGFMSRAKHVIGAGDKKEVKTGAKTTHPTRDAAVARVNELAAQAQKDGWNSSKRSRGSKADAFDASSLPKPAAKK